MHGHMNAKIKFQLNLVLSIYIKVYDKFVHYTRHFQEACIQIHIWSFHHVSFKEVKESLLISVLALIPCSSPNPYIFINL